MKNFYKKTKIIFVIQLVILKHFLLIKKINTKVCLCTFGKKENLYAKEFVEHYKTYGVDKIFIYDNNDLNDEYFDEVISEYIKNGYVKIINYRGKNKIQLKAIKNCYKNNFRKYDWFLFYDMDEFIYLKYIYNVKLFLNRKEFDDCKIILLNWVHRSDNELLYYDNRSLFTRFKKRGKKIKYAIDVKPILKSRSKIIINNVHFINKKIKQCDGFGRKKYYNGIYDKNPDYKFYYLDHFYTKSTEEFINKIKRGSIAFGPGKRFNILKNYFDINIITLEKINYIERALNINLSDYITKTNH